MTLQLNGKGVSHGIAIGQVRILHEIQPRVRRKKVSPDKSRTEIRRFRKSLRRSEAELERAKQQLPRSGSGTVASILDSHIAMLQDPALVEPIENLISEHSYSAEWALAQHRDQLLEMFRNIDDPYIKQRAGDIEETIARLLKHLIRRTQNVQGVQEKPVKFVLVTNDLAPSDLIQQKQLGLIGAITQEGSSLSHTTIIAKSLDIPLIVNVSHAMKLLDENDQLIIDGSRGIILANADKKAVRNFKQSRPSAAEKKLELVGLNRKITRTNDKQRVQILANISSLSDVSQANKFGAAGIGLFRTESLYLNREELPDENEQFQLYRRLVAKLKGAPLVIRTMDVWSSRRMPGIEKHVPRSHQPALGLRAIRLCLKHPEIFLPQLRALLRAAHYGPISMLLPMVSSVQEVRDMRTLIESTKAGLKRERRVFNQNLPVGVMIEVPSAAISARLIAPLVDFMAIGSNDLTQYTLAMDRDDANIQPLMDPLNPAILHLIDMTIKAANQFDIPVSICGEMAGEPTYTRVLLGLGLREFSMHPASILDVKRAVISADASELEKISRAMLRSNSAQKTLQLLEKINAL